MRGIKHHLLDVVSPKKVFSVNDYKKLVDKKIQELNNKGIVPILCGGTGLYIDAVTKGIILPEVPPNKTLRKELSLLSAKELFKKLQKLDKERAKDIDVNNKVRLIRAIEIAKSLGKVPKTKTENPYIVLKIGLTLPDEILKERIKDRLLLRIKKGMLKEINDLHKKGISWKRMHDLGLEYRYGSMYLKKEITKEEMIDKLNTEIWHYAKRQRTWFKRDKEIIWINPNNEVKKELKEFLC
jgi:tRNA dimethylallyltransferase